MAKTAPIQASINTGEISPLMYGRVDFDKYKNALKLCLNHIPLVQGPVTRRPGTQFVAEVKNSALATRVLRFEFSTTQAYILEIGNLYIRIYRNHAQVVSGTPVEIVTPYLTADIFQLMVTQSADTLYIAHQNYAPRKITRTSDTSWSITKINFLDGPYLPANATATTFTVDSAGPGNVNLTASSIVGVNGGIGFQATDVGRAVRVKPPGFVTGWGTIVSITSTTVVVVNLIAPVTAGAATAAVNWRLGLWSDTSGYPGCVTFYEDRLAWGASVLMPQTVNMSVTSDYENHAPTDLTLAAGVVDSNAISFTLNSEDVQVIRWMTGDANGLLVGTVASEWVVAPSTLNEALTPTNVKATRMTNYGSAQISPIRAGYSSLFMQKSARKLRELTFVYVENRYHAPDLSVLSQHITQGGIKEMAFQQEPNSIIWMVRSDGILVGFTYERDQAVVAWHQHQLGGFSDALGTGAKVESVATIPAPDGTRDELWLVVQRYINGAVHRYIEVMTKMWERGDAQSSVVYVDCALTYNGVATSTITGLTQVPGETVTILADGATHPTRVVSNTGTITLARPASVVQVGYGYNSDGNTLRNDAGSANGTAQGKTQRKHRVCFRLHDSLGLSAGPNFNSLTRRIVRTTGDPLGVAVPLFSGDDTDTWEGDYSTDDEICWRFDQPLPGTMLAIMPQQDTFDR